MIKKLFEKFRDYEYRHAFVEDFVDSSLATQIQVLREQRGLTQKELADLAGMKQSQISRLERVDNPSWQIRTLKRLARAFDVALVVKFEGFENVMTDVDAFSRASLERLSFEDECSWITDDEIAYAEETVGLSHIPTPSLVESTFEPSSQLANAA